MSDIASQDKMNLRYSMQKMAVSDDVRTLFNLLVADNKIREIDRSFALFVAERLQSLPLEIRMSEKDSKVLVALCALTSEQLSRQHVCLEINLFTQPWLPHFAFPDPAHCQQILHSDAFKALGLMVFDGERLYLQRYWQYEQQVVRQLKRFTAPAFAYQAISVCLARLYPESNTETKPDEPDWQKNAIALACLNSVTVIAGGPGTGKTTTVVRILWSLSKLYQNIGKANPIIKMVAPTGKAAARLSESVSGAVAKLPDTVNNIPKQCSTIHRLLGVVPNSVFFRHNEQHLLNIDVLVVDEASMIDLPLLAKLLIALPRHCRLILLGDSHQLASVEVGSVFSDICRLKQGHNVFSSQMTASLKSITRQSIPQINDVVNPGSASTDQVSNFADSILFLTKSWRFDADSGIGKLARAVNSGDVNGAFSILEAGHHDLEWHTRIAEQRLLNMVLPHFISLHHAAMQEDMHHGFELLSKIQILTVQRRGRWGLQHVNALVKQALVRKGLVNASHEFYPGRPVMISSNDYQNQLFNGDVGLVIIDADVFQRTGRAVYKVCFQDTEQGYRTLLPAQLPEHETMFAITTHKSQGSEFAKVIFCLPDSESGSGNELLNRELLYTGITRAKSEFVLFADKKSVSGAVTRVCKRASGLASVLIQHEL